MIQSISCLRTRRFESCSCRFFSILNCPVTFLLFILGDPFFFFSYLNYTSIHVITWADNIVHICTAIKKKELVPNRMNEADIITSFSRIVGRRDWNLVR
ncbi:hypothetical protein K445DRAFT_158795 [Daldinia sp. EC12]|nr:hypothetical protein K445DRAFT_158795 [Daldinia sp. EC12]